MSLTVSRAVARVLASWCALMSGSAPRCLRCLTLVVAPVALAFGVMATQASADARCSGQGSIGGPTTGSCSYTYSGAEQTFPVPAGVTSVTVDAVGAPGGGSDGVTGGLGAAVSARVPVTGISTL